MCWAHLFQYLKNRRTKEMAAGMWVCRRYLFREKALVWSFVTISNVLMSRTTVRVVMFRIKEWRCVTHTDTHTQRMKEEWEKQKRNEARRRWIWPQLNDGNLWKEFAPGFTRRKNRDTLCCCHRINWIKQKERERLDKLVTVLCCFDRMLSILSSWREGCNDDDDVATRRPGSTRCFASSGWLDYTPV